MEQPEDEAPAVEEPDDAKHDEAEAEQPQQDEEYYEGNEDEDQDGYGGYEDDDFHYEKRMRGGFRYLSVVFGLAFLLFCCCVN